ncbi:MAG: hypothetical protein ACXU8X_11775 [Caulobacteraceae bacterium]
MTARQSPPGGRLKTDLHSRSSITTPYAKLTLRAAELTGVSSGRRRAR